MTVNQRFHIALGIERTAQLNPPAVARESNACAVMTQGQGIELKAKPTPATINTKAAPIDRNRALGWCDCSRAHGHNKDIEPPINTPCPNRIMFSVTIKPTGTDAQRTIRYHQSSGRCAASKPTVGKVMHAPVTNNHAPVNRNEAQPPSSDVRKPASMATAQERIVITTIEATTLNNNVLVGCCCECQRPSIDKAGACTAEIMVP